MKSKSKHAIFGVHQTKRGIQIDFTYPDENGVQRRFRRQPEIATIPAARAEAEARYLCALKTGSPDARIATPTLAAYYDKFYRPEKGPGLAPSTRNKYDDIFEGNLRRQLGKTSIDKIDVATFTKLRNAIDARDRKARSAVNLLKSILSYAVERRVLASVPRLPKGFCRPSAMLIAAPPAEYLRDAEACLHLVQPWFKLAFLLARYAGMRCGEVCGIIAEDVDLDQMRIVVSRAMSDGEEKAPKNGKARPIPIAPEGPLAAGLRAAIAANPAGRLVQTGTGKAPTRTYMLSEWKRLQERADLPTKHNCKPWSFHSLRHAFCSQLAEKGVNLVTVQALAGHSSLNMTQRYSHSREAVEREAVATLAVDKKP